MKKSGRGRRAKAGAPVIRYLFRCLDVGVIKEGLVWWMLSAEGKGYYVRLSDSRLDDEKARACYDACPRYFAKPGPTVWHPDYGYFSSTEDLEEAGYVLAHDFLARATQLQRYEYTAEVIDAFPLLYNEFRFRHGDAHQRNIMVLLDEDGDVDGVKFIDVESATYRGHRKAADYMFEFHEAAFGYDTLREYLGLRPQAKLACAGYDIVRALIHNGRVDMLATAMRVSAAVLENTLQLLEWVYYKIPNGHFIALYVLGMMFKQGLFDAEAIALRHGKVFPRFERYTAAMA